MKYNIIKLLRESLLDEDFDAINNINKLSTEIHRQYKETSDGV